MIRALNLDLTRYAGSAVVNPANPQFLVGGGLSGALAKTAGPEYVAACQGITLTENEVHVTEGYGLPANYVLHAYGPRIQEPEVDLRLRKVMEAILDKARTDGYTPLGVPVISSGIFGVPFWRAFRILFHTTVQYSPELEVDFVIYDRIQYAHAEQAVARAFQQFRAVGHPDPVRDGAL